VRECSADGHECPGRQACPGTSIGDGREVYDLEGVLGPSVIQFVEGHVRSLLTWDILVYFHKNPDDVLQAEALALKLGRRPDELAPEVRALCECDILHCEGGAVRYDPPAQTRETIGAFVDACQDRGRRLALIALVLHKITPQTQE
jgi:hypothetical protein